MAYLLDEPPSGREGFGETEFSEAYLVSARYGECRRVSGDVLSIFQIACGINEGIVARSPGGGITFADLSLTDVLGMVPNGRHYEANGKRDWLLPDEVSYLTLQPILLIRREKSNLVLDGLKRLAWLHGRRSNLVRCVLISEKRAFYFGREGIDVFDAKERLYELDKKQRTLKNSVPPSIDAPKRYQGTDYKAEVRPAMGRSRRDRLPKLPAKGGQPNISQMGQQDRYLIEDTYLITLAPHIATVEHRRIKLTVEMTKHAMRRIALDTHLNYQFLMDRDIKIETRVFNKGNPARSIYEIFLVRFLQHLFDKIELLYHEIKEQLRRDIKKKGLLPPLPVGEHKYVVNPRVGYSIVNEDPRYSSVRGRLSDLRETVKDWADIATLTKGVFACGWHEGLFRIGLRRLHGPDDHPLGVQEEHAYELVQAMVDLHSRVKNQTSNSRELRQQNNQKSPLAELRFALDHAVDGELPLQPPGKWDADQTMRKLLALHARVNPAKIFLDETHLTLMYQWLVVLGDLNRNGTMIVTCHMAQEFLIVHRLRSGGANPALDSDWSLFDEALALAFAGHPASTNVVRELIDLCAKGMARKRAQLVTLLDDGEACFQARVLSEETSRFAEAALWLT